MAQYSIKLVPDNAPNDDGFWVYAEIPAGVDIFAVSPIPTHHIVKSRARPSLQDGGPMHAAFLPPRRVDYTYDSSWVRK